MSGRSRTLEDLAPEDFAASWSADSVEDALEAAERAPTSSDEVKKCPTCGTQRVSPAPSDRSETAYKCHEGHRFDKPVVGEPVRSWRPTPDEDGSAEGGFEWVSDDDLRDPPISRQLAELDDLALGVLAVRLYAPWEDGDDGPSYREIAEILPYSRQWIGERVRAWKNDDYFGGDGR